MEKNLSFPVALGLLCYIHISLWWSKVCESHVAVTIKEAWFAWRYGAVRKCLWALGLIALLYGSMFWQWLRGEWSPRAERWLWAFTLVVILPVVLFSGYTVLSGNCRYQDKCLLASGHLHVWLFP